MTLLVALLLACFAAAAVCIGCARFACRRFFGAKTKDCWLGRIQITITILVTALAVGIYLALKGHPPIAIALVLLPYSMVLFTAVSIIVLAAIRSGVQISIDAITGVVAVLLGTTLLVVVSLATGYATGDVMAQS